MARPLRIEYPGLYYPVTSGGKERKTIFLDDQNRKKLLELLSRAVKNALLVVLRHLLKYRFQPTHSTQSWRATLREHRRRLRDEFAR